MIEPYLSIEDDRMIDDIVDDRIIDDIVKSTNISVCNQTVQADACLVNPADPVVAGTSPCLNLGGPS